MIPIITSRRAALAAQLEQAIAQYDQLEATLKELDRQILAMHGGLLELDQLLAELALLDGDAIPNEPPIQPPIAEQMNADKNKTSAFIAPVSAVTDDRDDLIVRLREERDRLMSRLGVAHESIDIAEETQNGTADSEQMNADKQ